jgi:oligosaccharide repeat unit polymerase
MHSTTLEWDTGPLPVGALRGLIAAEKKNVLLLVHLTLIGVWVCAGLAESAVQIDRQTLLYTVAVAFTLSFTWILASWLWLRGSLFEPYPLFMIAAGLFNGGQAILEVFGLNSGMMLSGRAPADVLISALYLVTLCLMTTHAGALFSASGRSAAASRIPEDCRDRARATRRVGWILLAVAAVPASILIWQSVSIVLDYGYIWLYRRDDSTSVVWILTGLLVPGILFLLAGAKESRWTKAFCLALASSHAAIHLFLGSRGTVVISGVAFAWVFERSIRRLPRSLIIGFCLVGLVAISFVRETRGSLGRSRLTMDDQIESLSRLRNPIASAVSEMGYTLVTVTHTLSLVPASREFDHGTSYLYAASTIVPNLGWEVHPGKAHGLLSDWLVQTVEPAVAAAGGGLGYSFIAEAFLNFGWVGGPIWLAFLGFGVTRLFLLADAADPARRAFVASFLCSFLVFARGESATVVRGVVWYALVPYLLVLAISVRRRRRFSRQW